MAQVGAVRLSMATRTDPLLATKIDPLWDQEISSVSQFLFQPIAFPSEHENV